MAIPVLPDRLARATQPGFADQGQIGHGQRPARPALAGLDAVAIAKRIKLLDITELLAGLALDPGAQADFQGAVLDFERARRQCLNRIRPDAHGQDAWLVNRRGDDDSAQPNRQRRSVAAAQAGARDWRRDIDRTALHVFRSPAGFGAHHCSTFTVRGPRSSRLRAPDARPSIACHTGESRYPWPQWVPTSVGTTICSIPRSYRGKPVSMAEVGSGLRRHDCSR